MKKGLFFLSVITLLSMESCTRTDEINIIHDTVFINLEDDTINNIPSTLGFDSNGASYTLFSVSENKKIHFSRGNLQYQASTATWKFAEHQYDFIGQDNSNISSTYEGWIDLFGFGTSGWNSGATCYQPWSTSTASNDYYQYTGGTNNLDVNWPSPDWAFHNRIINGGNQTCKWRTLTCDEWEYLLFTRVASTVGNQINMRYVIANVNGVNGIIIFPDRFEMPSGLLTPLMNTTVTSYERNKYTAQQWTRMELNGAVFLPAAGFRRGEIVYDVGNQGCYWSSPYSSRVYFMEFTKNGAFTYPCTRYYGSSVRPVKD